MKNKTTNIDLSNFSNNIKHKKTAALGKGISALLAGDNTGSENKTFEKYVEMINLAFCVPSRFQARKTFDDIELEELAYSIKEHGILQPVILRKLGEESYEIIAGERRCRAAKLSGLIEVPALVSTMSDKKAMEVGLIENLQRENLNPLEEALAYKQLIDTYNYTHITIAESLGKSRSYITNSLRILNLPEKILNYLSDALITMGHAKILVSLENSEEIAEKVVKEKLSVRDLEAFLKSQLKSSKNKNKTNILHSNSIDQSLLDWYENNRNNNPNIKINLLMKKYNKGELKIQFKNIDDIKNILKI